MVQNGISGKNRKNLLTNSLTSIHIESGDKYGQTCASSAEQITEAKILLPLEVQLLSSDLDIEKIPRKRLVADSSVSGDYEPRDHTNDYFHTKSIDPLSKGGGDNDHVVTAATASTTSSECQDANNTASTTTTQTTTTSSGSGGDDDDRVSLRIQGEKVLGGNAIGNGSLKRASNGTKPSSTRTRYEHKGMVLQSTSTDGFPPRKKPRHNQHDSHNQRSLCHTVSTNSHSLNDDGSSLKVPGDDGSDRIVAGDIEGGVPIKPATVVASRLFTPQTSGTELSAAGAGEKRRSPPESSTQNQHNLLLPPHREPRYHTIRNTLYRFHSRDTNGNDKKFSNRSKKRRSRSAEKKFAKTNKVDIDPSSTDEVPKVCKETKTSTCSNNQTHHGDRSSASSLSMGTQTKRKSEQSRSILRSAMKPSTNPKPIESKSANLIEEGNVGGSSSGSGTDGTEDGYAGSVSSNENGSGNQQLGSSSSSPSETSSEECEQQEGRHKSKRHRRDGSKHKSSRGTQERGDLESSSEIADFGSSGSSETMDEEDVNNRRECGDAPAFRMKEFSASSSPSLSSSNYSDSDGLELAYLSAKRDADAEHERMLKTIIRRKKSKKSSMHGKSSTALAFHIATGKELACKNLKDRKPPILAMGCDVMAHILTFLHPPEILDMLTMPLSKCWRRNFTSQPELWRVLCLVEPFKAIMVDPGTTPSQSLGAIAIKGRADSLNQGIYNVKTEKNTGKLLDKYRLLYTSFVRCMKYVSQIRDDAINGRPPAYIDYGISGAIGSDSDMHSNTNIKKTNNRNSSGPPPPLSLGSNRNLQLFLAQARNVVLKSSNNGDTNRFGEETKNDDTPRSVSIFPSLKTAARVGTAHRKVRSFQL